MVREAVPQCIITTQLAPKCAEIAVGMAGVTV
jgi:hypothetical protein